MVILTRPSNPVKPITEGGDLLERLKRYQDLISGRNLSEAPRPGGKSGFSTNPHRAAEGNVVRAFRARLGQQFVFQDRYERQVAEPLMEVEAVPDDEFVRDFEGHVV